MNIKSEDTVEYASRVIAARDEDMILREARRIIAERFHRLSDSLITSSELAREYLMHQVALLGHETFGVLALDSKNRIISDIRLFRGTVNRCDVPILEVTKELLDVNAANCILYHNHPSGDPKPSSADKDLTRRLLDALSIFEIRLLDHIIIGGTQSVSLAEMGII